MADLEDRKVEDAENPGTYLRSRCLDDEGNFVSKPVHLDGSGGQLANVTPATAVFNDHYVYPEAAFGLLPIV